MYFERHGSGSASIATVHLFHNQRSFFLCLSETGDAKLWKLFCWYCLTHKTDMIWFLLYRQTIWENRGGRVFPVSLTSITPYLVLWCMPAVGHIDWNVTGCVCSTICMQLSVIFTPNRTLNASVSMEIVLAHCRKKHKTGHIQSYSNDWRFWLSVRHLSRVTGTYLAN